MADPREARDRLRQEGHRRQRPVSVRRVGSRRPRLGQALGRLPRLDHALLQEQGQGLSRRDQLEDDPGGGAARGRIENGELDALHAPAPQDIDRLKKNANLTVTQLGEESVWFIGPQLHADSSSATSRVRQAVSHALDRNDDRRQARSSATGRPLSGRCRPPTRPTHKAVEQFNQFDKEKSKSLMAAAGWKAGSDGILEKNGKKLSFELAVTHESFSDPARGGDPGAC